MEWKSEALEMKVRRCELELFALFLSRHYFVASLSEPQSATFNLWTWLLATADEKEEDEMRSIVECIFFGTISTCVSLCKKALKRKCFSWKWTRWHFRMEWKKTVSVILLQFYFHSLVLHTYVHDLLMQGFIHLKIGRFDLWWCGENLLSPEFFTITYIILVVNVLDMIFFGLFLDEYKGRRFHAWQLVSAAVKSRLRSH